MFASDSRSIRKKGIGYVRETADSGVAQPRGVKEKIYYKDLEGTGKIWQVTGVAESSPHTRAYPGDLDQSGAGLLKHRNRPKFPVGGL